MEINEQDQRVRLTRRMIREAFLELLAVKPIQRITVKELCQRAQINRGTFYAHYLDVYDLMEKIEDCLLDQFRLAMTAALSDISQVTTNIEICRRTFRLLESNSELITILLSDYNNKGIIEKFSEIGKALYIDAYHRFFPDTPREKLECYYLFISSGCIALLRQWFIGGMKVSVDELAQEAVKIMTYGAGYLKE